MYTRSGNGKQQSLTQSVKTMERTKSTSSLSSTGGDGRVESLDDLFSRLQSRFDETDKNIEQSTSKLKDEISTLRADIQDFKMKCTSEVKQLSDSVSEIRSDVALDRERIMYAERSNDLLLSGVPYVAGENLSRIVSMIAAALGYTEDNVPLTTAKRLARIPIKPGSTPPIALQFAFKFVRDEFYIRYLKARNLSLQHIGFNVNSRVYLNENLTELGRKIKTQAINLKKSGKLHSVYTRDGAVFVKSDAKAEPQMIDSLDQLGPL